LLYVSAVDVYKHQWHTVQSAAKLRQSGLPVELTLVGSAYPPALRRLRRIIEQVDPFGTFINYAGHESYSLLPKRYHQADCFVFASSCENLPNILLEAMAAGLPIACSERGPMPEILGDAGVYFDPESPESISVALRCLIEDLSLRESSAQLAYEKAGFYSWKRCARETFEFLAGTARQA
jgi:glycosyltransferase involved in cell wall biosynthesis